MSTTETPEWFKFSQAEARARVAELGAPQAQLEGWKYTSLKKLNLTDYQAPARSEFQEKVIDKKIQDACVDADYRLYFYDSNFLEKFSKTHKGEDLTVLPLRQAVLGGALLSEMTRLFLDRKPNTQLGGLGELNQAHFRDGAFIYIKAKSRVRVAIVHLYSDAKERALFCPRHVVYAGQSAEVEIVEIQCPRTSAERLISTATDVICDRYAHVSYAQVFTFGAADSFFSDTQMRLSEGAELQFANLSFGGRLIRNEILCDLLEPKASASLFSAFAATGEQHIDNSSFIRHIKGETKSRQTVKGVASGSSRGVFTGRLVIDQDAQKSDASQLNQSLLLDGRAEIDSRPQLEVFADDVKAAHGASVGEISPDEIFYLTSRGIQRDEARHMLGRAYVSAITDSIGSPFLKKVLDQFVGEISEEYFREQGPGV